MTRTQSLGSKATQILQSAAGSPTARRAARAARSLRAAGRDGFDRVAVIASKVVDIPPAVKRRPASFTSTITNDQGVQTTGKLDATVYLPRVTTQPEVVIPLSGFTGLKTFYPEIIAASLAERGFRGYAFDYPGFGASEGKKGFVTVEEQITAIEKSIEAAQQEPELAGRPIVLIGWGMAAGMAMQAVANIYARTGVKPNIRVAGGNGIYNVENAQREVCAGKGVDFDANRAQLKALADANGPLFKVDAYAGYQLDSATEKVVDEKLRPHPGYDGSIDIAFVESFLNQKADSQDVIDALAEMGIPMFLMHGKDNQLHPISEMENVVAKLQNPVETMVVDGRHNDFMDKDNAIFQSWMDRIAGWVGTTRQ